MQNTKLFKDGLPCCNEKVKHRTEKMAKGAAVRVLLGSSAQPVLSAWEVFLNTQTEFVCLIGPSQ